MSSSPPSRYRSQSSSPSLSSPSPSPPPSPQVKEEKRTLYMFFQHGMGLVSHSLYRVEIPSDPPLPIPSIESLISQSKNPKENPLPPPLLFYSNEFSYGMRCVQLGSKFYVLGGETRRKNQPTKKMKERKARDFFFPPNVYIFDPATVAATSNLNASDFLTPAPRMKTGKNDPIVFVAFGKIYALSAPPKSENRYLLESFEVFDPTTDEWSSLPPLVLNRHFHLRTHALVRNRVYIIAAPFLTDGYVVYCFDLNKEEWIPSSKLKCPYLRKNYRMAEFVEDTLYGMLDSTIIGFGPIKDTVEDVDGEFFKSLVHFSPEVEGPFDCLYLGNSKILLPTHLLVHLGNRRFCYVVSGNPPKEPLPQKDEDITFDPQTHYISITIFDTLIDTSFTAQDGTTYSKAKFLYSAHFVDQTPWDRGLGILRNSFLTAIATNGAGFGGEVAL